MSSSGRRLHTLAPLAGLSFATLAPLAARGEDLIDSSPTVAQVEVVGQRSPLARSTGLATLPGDIRDIPQIIDVVPQEVLQQQKVTSLQQALKNVPGITVAIGEGGTVNGDQFKIRGQDAANDIYIDGLRDFGVYTRDAFDTQEVQVLKGPSGAMFGRGTTGGAINSLSKQPLLQNFTSVDAAVGSGDYYRSTVDTGHKINDTTAMRLTAMVDANHTVDRDKVRSERSGVAAAIGFGIGTDTTLTVDYFHQNDDRVPDYGIVIGQPTGAGQPLKTVIALPLTEYGLDRSTFTQFAADRDRTQADILSARFSRTVNPWLTLTSDARLGAYSRYFQYTTVDGCYQNAATKQTCADALLDGDPATVPTGTIGGGGPYNQRAWGAQTISTAHARNTWGRFKNDLLIGVDLNHQESRKSFYAYTLPSTASFAYLSPGMGVATRAPARTLIGRNLLDPDPNFPAGYAVFRPTSGAVPITNTTGVVGTSINSGTYITDANGAASEEAVFATDRFWLTPRLSVIGGVRYSHYAASYNTTDIRNVRSTFNNTSDLVNPRFSIVYEPTQAQTYYVSWGRSATPIGTAVVGTATPIASTTQAFAPDLAEITEAGTKLSFLRNRVSATAAVFHINKDNAKQTDPATGEVSAQSSQKQEINGLELQGAGQILRGWNVTASYAYLDARIRQDLSCGGTPLVCLPNPVSVGRQVTYTPRNSATVWSTYEFHRLIPKLTVGVGLVYSSRVYLNYVANGVAPNLTTLSKVAEAPGNVEVDALVAYTFGRYRAALNAYNLADRLNYSSYFSNRAVPAPGRAFVFTVGATF